MVKCPTYVAFPQQMCMLLFYVFITDVAVAFRVVYKSETWPLISYHNLLRFFPFLALALAERNACVVVRTLLHDLYDGSFGYC